MQTINANRSTLAPYKSTQAMGRKSSPPVRASGPQVAGPTCDEVSVSSKAADTPRASNLWTTAMLGGLAAVTLAGCMSTSAVDPAIAKTALPEIQAQAQTWESAPVELLRTASGDVVVNIGIDNQVVNPDTGQHARLPGADSASWAQRGETVCQQALDLGGECQADNIALVTTPRGTLIIEQNEANSIDIYSQDGGHTGVSVQAGGIKVETHQGSRFFANDGTVRLAN